MSDPILTLIDDIFAAFDPGGAGTTQLSKLTGWPVSTIHAWKGQLGNIPVYRRADIVRAAADAPSRLPDEYKEPVSLTKEMLDYLDPEGRVRGLLNVETANAERTPQAEADKGATRAEEHAERAEPGWSAKAYEFLVRHARAHKRFLGEDVRLAAMSSDSGVADPPAPGAWGNVFKKAAKAGIIKKAGYEPSRLASTHGKAAVVWVVP